MFKSNRNFHKAIVFLLLPTLLCCKKTQKPILPSFEKYHLENGFVIEPVAAEPMIEAPVAIDFDNEGRIWVVCMNGYMLNTDGSGEDQPNGNILILEDKDNDGWMDHKTVFLDSLVLPRAIALVYGGLLYAEPPNLWFVEINNLQPGKRTLVDSSYAIGGNVEHHANGLLMNIDNWIYNARSSARYRKINEKWIKENTTFRGQWGITHDDFGRLFYNDNSNPLYGDFVMPNQLDRHPNLKPSQGIYEVIAEDRRVFPLHATSVNRGYMDGMLDENKKLVNFTSACGPLIYRGDQFPDEYYGNAFVCGPEVNLLKRFILHQKELEIQAVPAWEGKEFLAATDETFRPVNLNNAPDGTLYVVDFHRGIIQHKTYLTPYLMEQLIQKGLDTVMHYGRILRLSHGAFTPQKINLNAAGNAELVENLKSKNGWMRDRSQQLLVERQAVDAIAALEQLGTDETIHPTTRIHALWTLEGLNALSIDFLNEVATTKNPKVLSTVIRLSENFSGPSDFSAICNLALELNNDEVDLQLALSIGKMNEKAFAVLENVIERHPNDTLFYEAALSGMEGKDIILRQFLLEARGMEKNHPFMKMLDQFIKNLAKPKIAASQQFGGFDQLTAGLQLFQQHCASCHGHRGEGLPNMAPPLYGSEYAEGDPGKLILIALHGLKGPVHVNGKLYHFNAVMPGLRDNTELTDEKIAAILTYVRNGFGKSPLKITAEMVAGLREKKPKGDMYTEEELLGK